MEKITLLSLLILCLLGLNANSQIHTKFYLNKDADRIDSSIRRPNVKLSYISMPKFDQKILITEDENLKGKDIPFRFGKGFDVNITLKDGTWKNESNGRTWHLNIESKNAFSLNFIFEKLKLPQGAELIIYNNEGSMVYGPVTSKDNPTGEFFLTDLIKGDSVTFQLFEPFNVIDKSDLKIKKVVHAYKNLFSSLANSATTASGNCNKNIACYSDWTNESNAIAMVLLASGSDLCSGSLINNTAQNYRPFFLTAFHCIDINENNFLTTTEINDSQNWMFRFHYKYSSCTGSSIVQYVTYNKAIFRAAWDSSDFALMELVNSPVVNGGFAWLGWNWSGSIPTSGAGIHHPSGDVMKISFSSQSLKETSYGSSTGQNFWSSHIDTGTFEPGSSGSPLFDQNKRVIGQLKGGDPFCGSTENFWHGCFHQSWTGPATGGYIYNQLGYWLDPLGTANQTLNTIVNPYISGPPLVCSTGSTYTVTNLLPGFTVSWNQSSNLRYISGQGTNSYTVASNGGGYGSVFATISSTNSGLVPLGSLNVWVGPPNVTSISGPTPVKVGVGNSYYAYADYQTEASFTWWTSPATNTRVYPYSGTNMANIYFDAAGGYTVYAKASNVCGQNSAPLGKFVLVTMSGSMYLSPNPASDNVTITMNDIQPATTTTDVQSADIVTSNTKTANPITYTVRVLNSQSALLYIATRIGTSFTIPVNNLINGVYVVEVSDGKNSSRQQLVVSH